MSMYRLITLGAAMLAGAVQAATVPSDLMLPEPERAARGYVESWVLSIEIESEKLNGMDACRKLLAERGFQPVLSKTASTTAPALHFKVTGRKEYAQASSEADDTLAAVQQAKCPGTLSWNVSAKQARR
jgi:hypothetical protein